MGKTAATVTAFEARLGVKVPEEYRAWLSAPEKYVVAVKHVRLRGPDRVCWISGASRPVEDDLLLIGETAMATQLVFRVKSKRGSDPVVLRSGVYEAASASADAKLKLIAASFSELVSLAAPAVRPDANKEERAKLAPILLGQGPALGEAERVAAQKRHPNLFRAAALLGSLKDPRFQFLRTPEYLSSTEAVLRLEKDPARILDRLMGVFTRTEQLEDESARESLLQSVSEALGRM